MLRQKVQSHKDPNDCAIGEMYQNSDSFTNMDYQIAAYSTAVSLDPANMTDSAVYA